MFWTALYLWPLTWLAFFIIYFFRFQVEWVLLVAIGLTLSGANLVGYWKCSKGISVIQKPLKSSCNNYALTKLLLFLDVLLILLKIVFIFRSKKAGRGMGNNNRIQSSFWKIFLISLHFTNETALQHYKNTEACHNKSHAISVMLSEKRRC